ncbi:MAG: hypothetical protein AAEJ04_08675, partial [Planctomycetota bacterium]
MYSESSSHLEASCLEPPRLDQSRGERGSMLLIALAVLTLLSIIAVTFVALMRLELKATENFRDQGRSRLLGNSAESAVVAMLRSRPFWDAHVVSSRTRSPWIYGIIGGDGETRVGGILDLAEAEADEASLGGMLTQGTYPGIGSGEPGQDRYRVKLLDTSAQIYLNGGQDTLATMLTNLGQALASDDRYGVNPLWTGPDQSGKLLKGSDIIQFRNRLPGGQFSSKSELAALIGRQNLALLADFVTAHAWVNPYTQRSGAGREVNNRVGTGTQSGGGTVGTTGVSRNLPTDPQAQLVTGASQLVEEPRAPININTAPEPVLVATLMGLGGRRAFPYMNINSQSLESGSTGSIDLGGGTLAPVREELSLVQTPVWVYSQPLSIDIARKIAQAIISQRKQRAFKHWTAPVGSGEVGFEDFINNLDDSYFPQEATVWVINPQSRDTSNYYGRIKDADGSDQMWSRGYPNSENGIRRSLGLPRGNSGVWYKEMIRAILIANANPNTRINKVNPNFSSWRAVDKSGLVKLDVSNRADVRLGHTTEFCFDSKGIYEITSLAEITGSGSSSTEVFSESKRRSVVKVFDVYHHTTQEQFEQPFRALGRNSNARAGAREYVTSWPDPMDALQPDFYVGSNQDGRIEMSGAIDALMQVSSPAARLSRWSGDPTLRLAHTFRFRDEDSVNSLARMLRSPSNPEAKIKELGKVLDATYSQKGSIYRQRYSRYVWGAQDSANADENVAEVLVDETAQNSDLMPDGLNSSMFRTSALGARFLRLPALRFRSNPTDEGSVNRNYNNDIGNLPYYNGAVSFWVKMEFNGDDPTFSGLIGATQVQTNVGQKPTDSEGAQFWIWKNTEGQLRVSLLYYHQAFAKGYTSQAIPLIGNEDEIEDGNEAETDSQKFWARNDVVVDVAKWRAHEWHHLAVSYDDNSSTNGIRVWVDHVQVDAVNHNIGEGMFCALNEENPKDQIQIGGFFRDQAVAEEGLFKFGTNYDKTGALRAASIKRVLANATIDEFRVYLGQYTQDDSRNGGYYTEQEGTYTNAFLVPFPDGIQRMRLRNMTWTLYSPKLYAQQPVDWDAETMNVLNVNGQQSARRLGDPGGLVGGSGDGGRNNQLIAGGWLYPTGSQDYGDKFDIGFLG